MLPDVTLPASLAGLFAKAAWSSEAVGLAVAALVVSLLVPAGAPILVVVDDTLFKRTGRKVWAASWFHDGSAKTPKKWALATTGSSPASS
jgi:hypothetical protein